MTPAAREIILSGCIKRWTFWRGQQGRRPICLGAHAFGDGCRAENVRRPAHRGVTLHSSQQFHKLPQNRNPTPRTQRHTTRRHLTYQPDFKPNCNTAQHVDQIRGFDWGPSIYSALKENNFDITVLKRQSSKSKTNYPKQATVSDAFEIAELTKVFQGHDAVIVTVRGAEIELQNRIADAAVRAGMKRFIPADFGSVDSSSELTQRLVPLYVQKSKTRHYLIDLAEQHPEFTWTSLVCGHFFDWSLEFLHLWYNERKADILDDGNVKWSASTLSQIALATVRILQRPEVTKNRMICIESFCVTQNEVLQAFEKATGGKKWTVTRLDSKQYQEERVARRDEGDKQAIEDLVWLLGAIDANWEEQKDFAMKHLGLENEDLGEVVKKIVAKLEQE